MSTSPTDPDDIWADAVAAHPHAWAAVKAVMVEGNPAAVDLASFTIGPDDNVSDWHIMCLVCWQLHTAAGPLPCPGKVWPDQRLPAVRAKNYLPRDRRRRQAVIERHAKDARQRLRDDDTPEWPGVPPRPATAAVLRGEGVARDVHPCGACGGTGYITRPTR